MKVQELITALQQFNLSADVSVTTDTGYADLLVFADFINDEPAVVIAPKPAKYKAHTGRFKRPKGHA